METAETRFVDIERSAEDPGKAKSNSVDEWLPGLGLGYDVNEQWSLLAGVHRGFAPPGAGSNDGTGPELSTNYEWGARFNNGGLNGEVIAFFSDYENTVQNCSVATPCPDGADSGSFRLGEAEIKGLEASLSSEWVLANGWALPVRASYTYTNAKITEDSDTVAIDGSGSESGGQPGLPAGKRPRPVRRPGQRRRLSAYLKVDNLFDQQAIVNRGPDGARANRPRTATLGMKFVF